MSGVANPASDVIIVMGDDPDGSGGDIIALSGRESGRRRYWRWRNKTVTWNDRRKVKTVKELCDKVELGSRLPPSHRGVW
jgi:hypothetical protein